MLKQEELPLVLCVPGPWKNRQDFMQKIITYECGRFMYVGMVLEDLVENTHIIVGFDDAADSAMRTAFELAGRGLIPKELLTRIEQEHQSAVYLKFPRDFLGSRYQIFEFTKLIQAIGGYAIKIESSGVAHTWECWFEMLQGSELDLYNATVCLLSSQSYYYSCGMHLFSLPDCAVPKSVAMDEAINLINHFNYWRLMEDPFLSSGETFSLHETSPRYDLILEKDHNNDLDDLFYNIDGVWVMMPV